jgi:hypothetical protein
MMTEMVRTKCDEHLGHTFANSGTRCVIDVIADVITDVIDVTDVTDA